MQMKEKKQRKFSRPTTAIKHKLVLDKIGENGGNVAQALREVGYSEKIVDNPQRVLESKTFLEVLEDSLPDEKLSKAHEELLEQKRIEYFVFPKKMEDEEIKGHVESAGLRLIVTRESDKGKMAFYSIPDANAKSKALEMAYKLKGKFSDENKPPQSTTTYNLIFSGPVQEKVKIIDAEIKNMLTKTDDQEN